MKKIITILVGIFFLSIGYSQTYSLEFVVKNTKNSKGYISGALFSGEKNFPKKEKAIYTARVIAKEGKTILRFENIPAGEYALAVFHDENNNKDLDTNFIGIPKEGYAFSNNTIITFGPPKYDAAKIIVKGDYSSEIYLAY